MRPINLLPAEHRPRRASGAQAGSAYVVIGGLFAVLLLAGAYVLTANNVTKRQNEKVETEQQTQAARAKIRSLGAFGDFATAAQTRRASVKQVAAGRFDWERLTRELANVLPEDVSLTEVDAAVVPEEAATGSAAAGGGSGAQSPAGPSAKLTGCAKHQPDIAKLMVRLRQMNRVDEVQLKQSSKGDSSSSTGSSSGSSSGSGTSAGDCGADYSFEVMVLFDPGEAAQAPSGSTGRVPSRLGGGG